MRQKPKKPKATQNLAKDTETPKIKLKRLDVPSVAKAEISRMASTLDNYIAGVVAGLGIKGRWSFDMRKLQVIVEDTDGKNKT